MELVQLSLKKLKLVKNGIRLILELLFSDTIHSIENPENTFSISFSKLLGHFGQNHDYYRCDHDYR